MQAGRWSVSKYVDLRCSRRVTVDEARLILDCLDFARANAKGLRAKLTAAITLASHDCVGSPCAVCGQQPDMVARVRKRRAEDFQRRLKDSAGTMRKARAAAREDALRTPPALKFVPKPGGGA